GDLVTGVQTCALPIWPLRATSHPFESTRAAAWPPGPKQLALRKPVSRLGARPSTARRSLQTLSPLGSERSSGSAVRRPVMLMLRSEERRVGEEGRVRG